MRRQIMRQLRKATETDEAVHGVRILPSGDLLSLSLGLRAARLQAA
jgi:hypothetical protein